jgi:hypothetical protein
MGLPHHDLPPGPNVVTGWEKALEDVAGVTKIQAYSLQRFAGLLDQHASDDTYRTSPAYYALTGRRGLWTLTQDGTTVPFCWHPNISGEVLVFPPIGCNDLTPLLHGIPDLPTPPLGRFRLARFPPTTAADIVAKINATHTYRKCVTRIEEENVLDWKYPVHILSTERVAGHQGILMRRVRYALNRGRAHSPIVSNFDDESATSIAQALTKQWVAENAQNEDEGKLLLEPHQALLAMLSAPALRLQGRTYYVNGRLAGYAIWEAPAPGNKTANFLGCVSLREYNGLSTFIKVDVCDLLFNNNILFVNVGGSEMKGLDLHKRQFRPVLSIPICSMVVSCALRPDSFW